MQVSTNGVVSFGYDFTDSISRPFPLSTSDILLAPFWDDSNVEIGGQILFRLSDNQTLLYQVGYIIYDHLEYYFTPTMLFIVTWNRIPEFGGSPNIVSVTRVYPWKFHGLVNLLCSFCSSRSMTLASP